MAPNGRTYADWVQRLVPFLIDYVPVIALGIIGSFFLLVTRTTAPVISRGEVNGSLYTYTTVEPVPSIFGLFMVSLCSLLGFCYFLWNKGYKEGTTGKSIGKSKYGTSTTVREETGEPLGAGRGIGRAFLLWIEIGLIGFCFIGLVCLLWPLWDAKRQTLLSDKLTGAVVYND